MTRSSANRPRHIGATDVQDCAEQMLQHLRAVRSTTRAQLVLAAPRPDATWVVNEAIRTLTAGGHIEPFTVAPQSDFRYRIRQPRTKGAP